MLLFIVHRPLLVPLEFLWFGTYCFYLLQFTAYSHVGRFLLFSFSLVAAFIYFSLPHIVMLVDSYYLVSVWLYLFLLLYLRLYRKILSSNTSGHFGWRHGPIRFHIGSNQHEPTEGRKKEKEKEWKRKRERNPLERRSDGFRPTVGWRKCCLWLHGVKQR